VTPVRRLSGRALVILVVVLALSVAPQAHGSLPTVAAWNGACAGIGLGEATLAGDRQDPYLAWLVYPDGERTDVVWPPGYSARFTPDLEILDASGRVVHRAGDVIDGGCVTGWGYPPREAIIVWGTP
jgi:hypothetical protein